MTDTEMTCATCKRPMRHYKAKAADHPGTVQQGSVTECMNCNQRRRRAEAPAPEPSPVKRQYRGVQLRDEPCVLVRSDLRPSTYRKVEAIAKARRMDPGMVLSRIADLALEGFQP